MSCCVKNLPKGVKKLLNHDECVRFRGSYNKTNFVVNGNVVAVDTNICKNKDGYNLCSFVFDYVKGNKETDPIFTLETYTITSFNTDLTKQKGVITITNLYNDTGSGGVSTGGIVAFNVLGGNGIYSEIKTVIIDFNNTERQLYFCG